MCEFSGMQARIQSVLCFQDIGLFLKIGGGGGGVEKEKEKPNYFLPVENNICGRKCLFSDCFELNLGSFGGIVPSWLFIMTKEFITFQMMLLNPGSLQRYQIEVMGLKRRRPCLRVVKGLPSYQISNLRFP